MDVLTFALIMKIMLQGTIKRIVHWDSKLYKNNFSSLRQDRLKMDWNW